MGVKGDFRLDSASNASNILTSLEEKGISIVEDYIDQETLKTLKSDFDKYLSLEDNSFLKVFEYSAGKACKLILRMLDTNSTAFAVFTSDFFQEVANDFLKEEFELNKEIFLVEDISTSEHVAQQLHYDIARTLKFFIYLEDTTVENGAFCCVPGSQKWTSKMRENHSHEILPGNREFTRKLTDEFGEAIPIEGKAGTLIIFDTDVFHKAGKVSKGRRRVMRGHTRTLRSIQERKKLIQDQQSRSLRSKIKKFLG